MDDLASFKTCMNLITFYLKHVQFQTLHSGKSYYSEQKQYFEIMILLHGRAKNQNKTKGKKNSNKVYLDFYVGMPLSCLFFFYIYTVFFYVCLGICQQKWPHRQFRYVSSVICNYIEQKYWSVVLHISF